jgi:hypothetical protein
MSTVTYSRAIGRSQVRLREGAAWLLAAAVSLLIYIQSRTFMSVLPWTDEVMQIDAAVNLYLGKGWVSTAWQSQSQLEFWSANNPLYTAIMYVWISAFGFTPLIVRSLNVALAFIVTWVIVDTCRRARWIRSSGGVLLLAALLITDDALSFVYRSGRADLVTMLVVAILFRAFVLVESPQRRRLSLMLASMPLLACGLQSIPYVALLVLCDRITLRKATFADLGAIVGGFIVGASILLSIYLWKHTLVAYVSQTFASGYNIVGAALQAARFRDPNAVGRFLEVVEALLPWRVVHTIGQDRGMALLIAFLALMAVVAWRRGAADLARTACVGIVVALLIPYGMLASGRYAYYYAWMGAAPVMVAFVMTLEASNRPGRRDVYLVGIAVAVAASLVGMPLRVWRDVAARGPSQYSRVEQAYRTEAKPSDIVYADPLFYYAAKKAGNQFYSVTYAGGRGYRSMSAEECSGISIVMVSVTLADETRRKLGGSWRVEGELPSLGPQPIVILRRLRSG